MNGWWFLAGFMLAYVMGAVATRVDLVRGRLQVVRFFLLRCKTARRTSTVDEVFSWADELEERGTDKIFRGHVKDLPNSDNPEWGGDK